MVLVTETVRLWQKHEHIMITDETSPSSNTTQVYLYLQLHLIQSKCIYTLMFFTAVIHRAQKYTRNTPQFLTYICGNFCINIHTILKRKETEKCKWNKKNSVYQHSKLSLTSSCRICVKRSTDFFLFFRRGEPSDEGLVNEESRVMWLLW